MKFPVRRFVGAACAFLFLSSLALAGQLPARFTLGKYVPEQTWLFVHAVDNPERAWLDQKWADVFEALESSGIDKDLTTLVMSALSDEQRVQAQSTIDKVTSLVRGVNWTDLLRQEFVFAEGVSPSAVGYGYLFLARGAENSATANAQGLVAILKEIAGLVPSFSLSESKLHDADVWSLRMGGEKPDGPGFVVDLFRKGDVIGLAFDLPFGQTGQPTRQTLNDVLGLMAGQSTKRPIIAGARFQEALSQVKPPQECVVFFDTKVFLGDLGRLFDGLAAMAAKKETDAKEAAKPAPDSAKPADAGCTEESGDAKALGIIRKILSRCDFVDYTIATVETKGRRTWSRSAMRIQAGKESSPLATACVLRKPFERFDQFVPAEATGFSLDGFVDLGAIYKLALDFVAEEISGGADIVAGIKAKLAEVGFDPQRDIFDWFSGEMISVEMPAAVVTPMGGSDSVTMMRVKNPELASQKVQAFLDFLSSKMAGQGQPLMITPAKVNAEGFREIVHPMLVMFVRPVVGVHGDWLMIGTSAGAVNKCLDTASGKSASIKENKRFKEEGLTPTGAVVSASFRDTSNFGQELAGGVMMLGFVGNMVVAGIPEEDADTKQFKRVIQSALSIAGKLGPVLQKIDFYSSESAVSTYDGKLTVSHESVVTYKNPKADEPQLAKTPDPSLPVQPTPPLPPASPPPPKPPQR